jgi:hypothetical protein
MRTRGSCRICRVHSGKHRFDILNDSGGVPVEACRECSHTIQEKIDTAGTRCFWCSESTTRKYKISEYGAPGEGAPICSECRDRVYFGKGRPIALGVAGGVAE